MLIYSIENMLKSGKKTIYINGNVDSSHWEQLRTVFFDALSKCEHLVINIERIGEYDDSFTLLICSTRKSAQHLGKQLTIQGRAEDAFPCIFEFSLHNQGRECRLSPANTCYLWESRSQLNKFAELSRKWRKRPPHKRRKAKMGGNAPLL